MRVKDIMTTPVVTVAPDTPLKEVAALLIVREISGVPVVDEAGRLLGILSEADLVGLETEPAPQRRMLPQRRREPIPTTAAEAMVTDVITLAPDADVSEAARLMLERRVKRLPIVEDGHVIGIVSRRDVLRVLARADGDIQRDLEELLRDEILMLGSFEPAVSGGIVTLRGPADRASRRLAELLARSVPGVLDVRFDDGE